MEQKVSCLTGWISLSLIFVSSCSLRNQKGVPVTDLHREIIALERSALDRWITLDPQGYLELSAPEVTYFDPMRDKRVDGLEGARGFESAAGTDKSIQRHYHGSTLRDD
jgi:hypothetical protein